MKDIFNRLIPELADIINLQSCALFSVSSDREQVVLEAVRRIETTDFFILHFDRLNVSFPLDVWAQKSARC